MGGSEAPDPLDQPWQERLLIFVLLCAMVVYLARMVGNFRGQGLTVRREASGSDASDADNNDAGYDEEHSD